MAYADKERFPTGPWCKEGDFVLYVELTLEHVLKYMVENLELSMTIQ
jgi:hypothetical protein